jgi:hypothetical protein
MRDLTGREDKERNERAVISTTSRTIIRFQGPPAQDDLNSDYADLIMPPWETSTRRHALIIPWPGRDTWNVPFLHSVVCVFL